MTILWFLLSASVYRESFLLMFSRSLIRTHTNTHTHILSTHRFLVLPFFRCFSAWKTMKRCIHKFLEASTIISQFTYAAYPHNYRHKSTLSRTWTRARARAQRTHLIPACDAIVFHNHRKISPEDTQTHASRAECMAESVELETCIANNNNNNNRTTASNLIHSSLTITIIRADRRHGVQSNRSAAE